ncbi:hypothetical protein ACHAWO_000499 [Cyclotella atomus]|uniref:Uncharacterized protein n=1 Tax=Cyclotella atomus TaxID=382360 RepID=A0ABD3PF60_9STRA
MISTRTMRFLTSISLAASACLQAANAFAPSARRQHVASLSIRTTKSEEAPCTISEDFALDESSLVNVPNGATPIRTGIVTNYSEWYSLNVQQQLLESGIRGPTFVSIGDAEKLNAFLDANPWIDRQQMFVDDYSFDVYKAAGFTRFDQVDKEKAKSVKMTAPDLKFGEWMTYFGTVGKVSPIPKDMKFGEVPEGVLWTGGTFVVQGNEVLYQWTDTVPGNHPVIDHVLKAATENKKAIKSESPIGKILPWF